MSGDLGEVIRQLLRVIGELDRAAVTAGRARDQAEQALAALTEAAQGTNDPAANQAITEARTAAEKAGKSARLFAEAAGAFAEYANVIVPGSAPTRTSTPRSLPDGQALASSTGPGGPLSSRLFRRMTSVPNADDGLQHASKLASAIQDAAGKGATAVPRSPDPIIRAAETRGGSAGDALLAAFTLALLGVKGAEVAGRLRKKVQADRRSKKQEGDTNG
ncbi:hypothetical protein AB0J86_34035 [Micromonospora sp. NPDC049559]|uniref:hypothetical protein n=1 Tax=Micromonospora sp. NPDC049559 TaxID=3155923 RepID=UPI00342456AC